MRKIAVAALLAVCLLAFAVCDNADFAEHFGLLEDAIIFAEDHLPNIILPDAPADISADTPTDAPAGRVRISADFVRQSGWASNQFAIWIEDAQGTHVRTLYATRWTAAGGYATRPMSVPDWVAASNLPSLPRADVDTFAHATPPTGTTAWYWDLTDAAGLTVPPGTYRFVAEASLRWANRVVFSGSLDIGAPADRVYADAQFHFTASAEHGALDMDAAEVGMFTNVFAEFVPSP